MKVLEQRWTAVTNHLLTQFEVTRWWHPGATARPKVVQQETQSRSSTDVSWVSKLKEHYDRLGKSAAVLDSKYKLKTTADGGFVYRIYVPELGREVEGDVAKSKKAKYSQENYWDPCEKEHSSYNS